ncbi:hypothetical protein CB0940_11102 [Cercospora beticola]|uniref:Metallo-beta-lactamase domain-containing protein n=2 Tax=Cercospora beticola TaxID=122368 RepID=A0A2G5HDN2_CERBT|nr:hypothetical protein CB0940_11102 [Cercospora beticola]PIA90638.1 hypothetical protein CB0940_11102 [Cercospora beticola]
MWSEGRKRSTWRNTWAGSPGGPGWHGLDAAPRRTDEPQSHTQSPLQSRHTLHATTFREFASACALKFSKSRNRMSFRSANNDREMVSPVSDRSSGGPTGMHAAFESAVAPPMVQDDMEGVQVITSDIEPIIHTLYEQSTNRHQYLVADPSTKEAIIIDPVLDRNPYSPGINTTAADQILYLVKEYNYHVVRILETHAVQDHPTSAWYLRTQLRDNDGQFPRICTGKALAGVQRMFARQYGVQNAGWGSKFDSFRDGQVFAVGEMRVQCIHLLSEPDWFGFVIGHNVFLGKEVSQESMHSASVRPTMQVVFRKLARFANNYAFHPQKQQEISRPSTAQTEVSEWMHEPATPRGSISMRRMISRSHLGGIGGSRSSISSEASSRQSQRRISQIPELA